MEGEPWTESKWTANQLNKALTTFRIERDGKAYIGKGTLWAFSNSAQQLRIRLKVMSQPSSYQTDEAIFHQTEESLFRIEQHPNPDEAAFHLTIYTPHGSSPAFQ